MEKMHLFFMPQQNQLSESGDCMSSSEDAPETETGEQDSMSAKKKQETELQELGCSELQEDIQCPGPRRHSVHCLMSRSDGATLGHQCVEAAVLAAPLPPRASRPWLATPFPTARRGYNGIRPLGQPCVKSTATAPVLSKQR